MEENEHENENPNSMIVKIISFAGILSSDPLFSTISTLYILFLLYFPPFFFKFVFSPVLIITLVLLLTLLRFGATQRHGNRETTENNKTDGAETEKLEFLFEDHNWVTCKDSGFDPDPRFEEKFVEWNVRAPLEVIYEAYEGEEGEEKHDDENKDPKEVPPRFGIERHASLSLYYPESDSDTSSDSDCLEIGDWGSRESVHFRWEDDDREGLIEIALDGVDNRSYNNNNNNKRDSDYSVENFHEEEENNLIEINISPANDDGKWRSSGEGY